MTESPIAAPDRWSPPYPDGLSDGYRRRHRGVVTGGVPHNLANGRPDVQAALGPDCRARKRAASEAQILGDDKKECGRRGSQIGQEKLDRDSPMLIADRRANRARR
jgi:hypothetical protein